MARYLVMIWPPSICRVCEDHQHRYPMDSEKMVELLSLNEDEKYRSGVLHT